MSTRLQRMKARLEDVAKQIEDVLNAAVDENGEERGLNTEENDKIKALKAKSESIEAIIAEDEEHAKTYTAVKSAAKKIKADEVGGDDDEEDDEAPATKKKAVAKKTRDRDGIIKALTSNPRNSSVFTSLKSAKEEVEPHILLAITAGGLARQKALPGISLYDHIEALGFAKIAEQLYDEKIKALSTTGVGSGAEMMPEYFSTQFAAFLHPQSSILRARPTIIDLSGGNLTMSGGNAGASASYRQEGTDIAYTQPTFREINLQARNLSCLTAVNNELLQRSPLAVAEILKAEMTTAFALAMDYAGLRGDGTANAPVGLLNLLAAAAKFDAIGAVATNPTVEEIDTNAVTAIQKVRSQNIPYIRMVWIMSNRTALFLATKRGDNGEKIYPGMDGENPVFWGYPVVVSNQVSDTMGAGTDESEIYLQDMGHFWMGDTKQMQVSMSEEASYVQGGALISAFSRNQSVLRLVGAHDFQVRYDRSGAVIQKVKWGS